MLRGEERAMAQNRRLAWPGPGGRHGSACLPDISSPWCCWKKALQNAAIFLFLAIMKIAYERRYVFFVMFSFTLGGDARSSGQLQYRVALPLFSSDHGRVDSKSLWFFVFYIKCSRGGNSGFLNL